MRVAWSADFGHIDVDPAVAERVGATDLRLADADSTVDEPRIRIEEPWSSYVAAAQGEAQFEGNARYLSDPKFMARRREPANLARQMEWSQRAPQITAFTRQEYEDTKGKVARLGEQFTKLFERYDAILSPTLLVDGLPVGLQIIGRYGREDQVLRSARTRTVPAFRGPSAVGDGIVDAGASPGAIDTLLPFFAPGAV